MLFERLSTRIDCDRANLYVCLALKGVTEKRRRETYTRRFMPPQTSDGIMSNVCTGLRRYDLDKRVVTASNRDVLTKSICTADLRRNLHGIGCMHGIIRSVFHTDGRIYRLKM